MAELLHTFGIEWHLLLIQAINFALVLVVLRIFLYKPVVEMLEKRRALVAKGVEDAKQAHEALMHSEGEARARVLAGDKEAGEIVASARKHADEEKQRLAREAEAHALAVKTDAEARAKETLERARKESEEEVARLAVLAAEKILKAKV